MDAKFKIEVKEEPMESFDDKTLLNNLVFVQVSGLEERIDYSSIDIKEEIETKYDPLGTEEKNSSNENQERIDYSSIDIKDEINIKDEPLCTEEKNSPNENQEINVKNEFEIKDEPFDEEMEERSNDQVFAQNSRLDQSQNLIYITEGVKDSEMKSLLRSRPQTSGMNDQNIQENHEQDEHFNILENNRQNKNFTKSVNQLDDVVMSDIEGDSSSSECVSGTTDDDDDDDDDDDNDDDDNDDDDNLNSGVLPISCHLEDNQKRYTNHQSSLKIPKNTAHTADAGKIEVYQEGSKKQGCLYCRKLVSKIGRHYVEVHHDKIEVKKIISMPVNSEKRRRFLRKLMLEGNFYHNISVLKQKEGKFIVQKQVKRKGSPCKAEDYVPCVNCLGFYYKRDAWRHFANCNVSKNQLKATLEKGYQLLNSYVYELTEDVSIFFGRMKKDKVTAVASQDNLIASFVQSMLSQKKNIRELRQHVRLLSRFLIKLREQHGEEYDLKSFIDPSNFDNLVRTAKSMSNAKDKPDNPITLGIHLGQVLCKCCTVLNIKSLKTGDKNMEEKIKNFETLLRTQWNQEISIPLRVDLHEKKENKSDNLPATEDIITLSKSINERISLSSLKLKENVSEHNWRELANVVLAHLILFNKRREREVSRMLLSDYLERPVSFPVNEGREQSLSVTENALLQKLNTVRVLGKWERHIPILLTEKAELALDILYKTRCQVVSAENPFMFPSKGVSHIRGSDAIANEAKHCDLKQPELLNSTRMKKYVSTVSQIMNLKENEIKWLASHLGHDINIHRNFYRLQDSTIELTKIIKLLIAIDEGYAHRVAGKNLDTVNEEKTLSTLLTDCDEYKQVKGGNSSSNRNSIKMEKVTEYNSELVTESMASGEKLLEKEDAPECSNNPALTRNSNNREMLIKKEEVFECSDKAVLKRSFVNNMMSKKEEVRDCSNVTVTSSGNDELQSYATYIKEGSRNISQRRKWSEETKSLAFKYFSYNIKNKIPPKQSECFQFIFKYKIKNRSWKDVKTLIFNKYYEKN